MNEHTKQSSPTRYQLIGTSIKRFINNMPLIAKFTYIFTASFLLLIVAFTLCIFIVTKTSNQMLYKSTAASLSHSATLIKTELKNAEDLSFQLLSSEVLQKNFSYIKDHPNTSVSRHYYTEAYQELIKYSTSFPKNHIQYVYLSNGSYGVTSDTLASYGVPADIYDTLCKKAEIAEGKPVWVPDYAEQHGLFLCRSIRRIKNTKLDTIGFIIICMDIEQMSIDATQIDSEYENSSYLIMADGLPICRTGDLKNQNISYLMDSFSESYKIVKLQEKSYFSVRGTISPYGWDYISLIPYDSMMSQFYTAIQIMIFILLFMLAAVFILSKRMISSIIHHFDNLIFKIKTFQVDEQNLLQFNYDYSLRKDEIGQLHQQFDLMATRIQKLVKDNYLNELLKKEAQLKALETQINPHFLYNTLESINWRAKTLGDNIISSMVKSLGTLLRSTLNRKAKTFTISQELELVNAYITIQKIRFESRLQFTAMIDEGLNHLEIPFLCIQPLIENAIRYGLEENTDVCYIYLSVQQSDGLLSITVKNTGSIFEDDIMQQLENDTLTPYGFGIGLLNIDKRIKLMFGNEYGLFLSNDDDLAVATILIPARCVQKKRMSNAD